MAIEVQEVIQVPDKKSYVLFGDTDSVFSQAKIPIVKNNKIDSIKIESFFNTNKIYYAFDNREFVFPILDTITYDPISQQNVIKPIQYIYRHKVSKEQFKIIAETGEEVQVTKDHPIMVERNGKLIETNLTDIKETDLLIIQD